MLRNNEIFKVECMKTLVDKIQGENYFINMVEFSSNQLFMNYVMIANSF